jgi:hypothetical protein
LNTAKAALFQDYPKNDLVKDLKLAEDLTKATAAAADA